MNFDTSGPIRLTHRSDGWYVIGDGMLIPVNSEEEGEKIKDQMTQHTKPKSSGGKVHPTFESFVTSGKPITEENSIKDLVGKSDDEELDLDDARTIGKKISKMHGDDRKKYVGIINFMGASCRIYNEIWANYTPVDAKKKKSNHGKEFSGDKEVG